MDLWTQNPIGLHLSRLPRHSLSMVTAQSPYMSIWGHGFVALVNIYA